MDKYVLTDDTDQVSTLLSKVTIYQDDSLLTFALTDKALAA